MLVNMDKKLQADKKFQKFKAGGYAYLNFLKELDSDEFDCRYIGWEYYSMIETLHEYLNGILFYIYIVYNY